MTESTYTTKLIAEGWFNADRDASLAILEKLTFSDWRQLLDDLVSSAMAARSILPPRSSLDPLVYIQVFLRRLSLPSRELVASAAAELITSELPPKAMTRLLHLVQQVRLAVDSVVVQGLLQHEDKDVRRAAGMILATVGDRKPHRSLWESANFDANPELMPAALIALGQNNPTAAFGLLGQWRTNRFRSPFAVRKLVGTFLGTSPTRDQFRRVLKDAPQWAIDAISTEIDDPYWKDVFNECLIREGLGSMVPFTDAEGPAQPVHDTIRNFIEEHGEVYVAPGDYATSISSSGYPPDIFTADWLKQFSELVKGRLERSLNRRITVKRLEDTDHRYSRIREEMYFTASSKVKVMINEELIFLAGRRSTDFRLLDPPLFEAKEVECLYLNGTPVAGIIADLAGDDEKVTIPEFLKRLAGAQMIDANPVVLTQTDTAADFSIDDAVREGFSNRRKVNVLRRDTISQLVSEMRNIENRCVIVADVGVIAQVKKAARSDFYRGQSFGERRLLYPEPVPVGFAVRSDAKWWRGILQEAYKELLGLIVERADYRNEFQDLREEAGKLALTEVFQARAA